jgi:hypothetical protein
MMPYKYQLPLPGYTIDLLLATKAVLDNETLTNAGDKRLGTAVEVFEDNMPLSLNGEMFMTPKIGGAPDRRRVP